MLARDYLGQEGYYYAPDPSDYHQSTSDVKEQEVLQLAPKWKPVAARIDPNMIDVLTDVLHDALGNATLPEKISETYFSIKRFEQEESKYKVESEQDIRTLVSGSFLTSLFFISGPLEQPFIVSEEGDSTRDARSKVDIILECDPQKRALLELKNPTVFSEAKILLHEPFVMKLASGALTTGRKVINKLALYMALYRVRWAALTCHNEWVLFRLHTGTEQVQPYLSFSPVVSLRTGPDDRTKPLRAFWGMLIATAWNIDVVSGADLGQRLKAVPENEYENADEEEDTSEGSSGSYTFFRLHTGTEQVQPYLSFSPVVSLRTGPDDRTKPLRAFLGMLIATAWNIDVVSGADLGQRLKAVPDNEYEDANEEDDNVDDSTQDNSDELYHPPEEDTSEGSSGSYTPRHRNEIVVEHLTSFWSLDVTPANTWLKFYATNDAKHIGLPLDPKPVRLRFQHIIGAGSTGCVYEAKVVDSTQEIRPDGLTYAMKIVNKGTSGEERTRIARLFKEFKIYSTIEEARQKGIQISAVPRCYGLYETKYTLALVLDYAGESLSELRWANLKANERENIFQAIKEVHELGISHDDLDPRNVQVNFIDVKDSEQQTV
ncbi:hypothetical protein A7U60_g5178 [Sanghuangporus baumii]|uniref:Protein kinase domain-containing protein n=1 Tax=Sanghuangporus baumii TaxID=108892 RepID=A0A9Q5HXQ2_SANBA|nr:hypothetical protein A7U60_g5178 [Sanghuangporus baumii]